MTSALQPVAMVHGEGVVAVVAHVAPSAPFGQLFALPGQELAISQYPCAWIALLGSTVVSSAPWMISVFTALVVAMQ